MNLLKYHPWLQDILKDKATSKVEGSISTNPRREKVLSAINEYIEGNKRSESSP